MKKILLVLFSIYFTTSIFAQKYEIEYEQTTNLDLLITSYNKLLLEGGKSIYYQQNQEIDRASSDNEILEPDVKITPFIIKDYKSKKIVYNQSIVTKIFFIEENLPLQKWNLIDESKKINNFICKKATTTFRGRNYIAWYTEDIPIIGGPWKFDGLPGLILEVKSDDDAYKIKAISIKNTNEQNQPLFKYDEKELITWKDYCEKFQEFIERIKKNMKADSDPDVEYELNINMLEDVGVN